MHEDISKSYVLLMSDLSQHLNDFLSQPTLVQDLDISHLIAVVIREQLNFFIAHKTLFLP